MTEIPITQEIIDRVKPLATGFHSIIDIRSTNIPNEYSVDYVSIRYWQSMAPEFRYDTICKIDIRSALRDAKIKGLMKASKKRVYDECYFDVESLIYTPAQLEKIQQLRTDSTPSSYGWKAVNKVKMEYSENFEVGQKVFYNDQKGYITFKHEHKENTSQRWSVKIGDTEHRRIFGYNLLARKEEDLSNIKIDKELNKLSTIKLLKMYRKNMSRNNGVGDRRIKRILNEREHIQKGETKIVWH